MVNGRQCSGVREVGRGGWGAHEESNRLQELGLGLKTVGIDSVCGGFVRRDWLGWRCSVDGVVD
jgi:hypothetical protein